LYKTDIAAARRPKSPQVFQINRKILFGLSSVHVPRREAVRKRGKAAEPMARLACTRRAFLPCNYIGSFNARIIPAGSRHRHHRRRRRRRRRDLQGATRAPQSSGLVTQSHTLRASPKRIGPYVRARARTMIARVHVCARSGTGCLGNPGWSPARYVPTCDVKVYLSRWLQQQLLMRAIISSRTRAHFYLDHLDIRVIIIYGRESDPVSQRFDYVRWVVKDRSARSSVRIRDRENITRIHIIARFRRVSMP